MSLRYKSQKVDDFKTKVILLFKRIELSTILKMKAIKITYVRGDKISNHIESNPPPNGTKDVARKVLHATQKANGVVDLRKVLEEEDDQEDCHY